MYSIWFLKNVSWTNNYIDTKAKRCHLKNWHLKGLCARCLKTGNTVSNVGIFDPALWTVAPLTFSLVQLHCLLWVLSFYGASTVQYILYSCNENVSSKSSFRCHCVSCLSDVLYHMHWSKPQIYSWIYYISLLCSVSQSYCTICLYSHPVSYIFMHYRSMASCFWRFFNCYVWFSALFILREPFLE